MLGVQVGGLVHVAAAALGLSALLLQSATAFNVVKFAGAAYLVFLGLRKLLTRERFETTGERPPRRLDRLFAQGIVVNVLNPKTALFFFAFLPQFVDVEAGSVGLQIAVLGVIFILIAIVSDGTYALAAGTASDWLRGNPRFLRAERWISGTVLVGLGVTAALSGPAQAPSVGHPAHHPLRANARACLRATCRSVPIAGSADVHAPRDPVERLPEAAARPEAGRLQVGDPPVRVDGRRTRHSRPSEARAPSARRRRRGRGPPAWWRRPRGRSSRAAARGRAPPAPGAGGRRPARRARRRSTPCPGSASVSSQSARNTSGDGRVSPVKVGASVWWRQISATRSGAARRSSTAPARTARPGGSGRGSAPLSRRPWACMCANASRNHGSTSSGTAGTRATCSSAPAATQRWAAAA